MTTHMDLKVWFDTGVKQKASHMIVVTDSFDHEDYPAYVLPGQNVHERINHYRLAPMQRIMEIYDLAKDRDSQLGEIRTYNYPPFPPIKSVDDDSTG